MMMLFIMAVLVIVVMFFVFVMMMVLIFLMVIFVVVMVFMFFFLHAFRHFFFIQFDGIHHFECFQLALVHGVQYTVHPFIGIAAGVNEKVALADGLDVFRRRFIAVGFRARFEKHRDLCFIADNLADKVVRGEIGTDDFQRFFPLGIGSAALV